MDSCPGIPPFAPMSLGLNSSSSLLKHGHAIADAEEDSDESHKPFYYDVFHLTLWHLRSRSLIQLKVSPPDQTCRYL